MKVSVKISMLQVSLDQSLWLVKIKQTAGEILVLKVENIYGEGEQGSACLLRPPLPQKCC